MPKVEPTRVVDEQSMLNLMRAHGDHKAYDGLLARMIAQAFPTHRRLPDGRVVPIVFDYAFKPDCRAAAAWAVHNWRNSAPVDRLVSYFRG